MFITIEIKENLSQIGEADGETAAWRLREELSACRRRENAVRRFNENLQKIDSEDFWQRLTLIAAELMKSGRASLLVFDEKSASFQTKSAVGITVDRIRNKSKSFISYPLEVGGRKIGVLNFAEKADGEIYNQFDLELLDAIAPQIAILIDRAALKQKTSELERLSATDALTGLRNRRHLEERLTEEIKRSSRYGFPLSFLMIDIDEFKSYNDKFLHVEGDEALKLVARHLKETLRGTDIAARYGGDEFSILLPQTTASEAAVIAERLRRQVEAADFPNRKITVSLGVAGYSQIICTPQEIIKAADEALYEAKRQGRNNVQIYKKLKRR